MCSCGFETETTLHYLLRCNLYSDLRKELLNDVFALNPTLKNLSHEKLLNILLYVFLICLEKCFWSILNSSDLIFQYFYGSNVNKFIYLVPLQCRYIIMVIILSNHTSMTIIPYELNYIFFNKNSKLGAGSGFILRF